MIKAVLSLIALAAPLVAGILNHEPRRIEMMMPVRAAFVQYNRFLVRVNII
jgi:hypothetical protein